MFSIQARPLPFDDDELELPPSSRRLRRARVFVGADAQQEREGPSPSTWWGGGSTPVGAAARIRAALPTLLEVLPDANDAEIETLLGDVESESQFGYAFKTPDGSPSHNWGAIYAPGDRGTIPVQDTADGKSFTAGAAWNSSALVGARQFVNVIRAYGVALERARQGDAWGYALALFRDGHGYYGGFPPGHKWSLAPKGTPLHSPLDHYYRVLAYARMVQGAAQQVASVLGKPMAVHVNAPPPPSSSTPEVPSSSSADSGGSGGVIVAGAAALVVGVLAMRRMS